MIFPTRPRFSIGAARIGKFYRPKKKPVTMRLDSDIIAWLKAVAAVIKPKQIGCCGTPCFISRTKRTSVGGGWQRDLLNPAGGGNTNDQPEGFRSSVNSSTRCTTERASQRCSASGAISKSRVTLPEVLLKARTRVAPAAGLQVAVTAWDSNPRERSALTNCRRRGNDSATKLFRLDFSRCEEYPLLRVCFLAFSPSLLTTRRRSVCSPW